MEDESHCLPSIWSPSTNTRFNSSSSSNLFIAKNLSFTREEVVSSDIELQSIPTYRPTLRKISSRQKHLRTKKVPLSVIVKRQCPIDNEPPSLNPSSSNGEWTTTRVSLRLDGDQVETNAWAFTEHRPLDEDIDDERSRHLIDSNVDPPLYSAVESEPWQWSSKERSRSPECTHNDDLPTERIEELLPTTECVQDLTTHEVVERSLMIRGDELRRSSQSSHPKRYPCPEQGCQSVLANVTALRKHKLVHAPKIFSCSQCSRSFAERTKLNRHERTHSGEKPYKCTFENCSKSFAHSFNLSTHMKLHNDERPYECEHCGHRFAKTGNLRVHLLTHTRRKGNS